MTRHAWITIGVLLFVMGLLTLTSIGPDLVMLAGLTLLLVLGVVTPDQAMAGFANEGVVTIGILFVVAAGLRRPAPSTPWPIASWAARKRRGKRKPGWSCPSWP